MSKGNSVKKLLLVASGLLALAAASDPQIAPASATRSQTAPAGAAATPLDNALPTQYCIGCHNQRSKTAGLTLDTMDYAHLEKDAVTWEKVVRKIKTGMMPPSGQPRPSRATLDAFAMELENRLDKAASASPNPGAPEIHRLNRTE